MRRLHLQGLKPSTRCALRALTLLIVASLTCLSCEGPPRTQPSQEASSASAQAQRARELLNAPPPPPPAPFRRPSRPPIERHDEASERDEGSETDHAGHDHAGRHHDEAPPLPEGVERLSAAALKARVEREDAPPLLVHVWASWCAPCREEWPALRDFASARSPEALELLALSVDPPELWAHLTPFTESLPPSMRLWWWEAGEEALASGLGGGWDGALPMSALFCAGERVRVIEGPASAEDLQQALDSCISAPGE